MRDLWDFRRPAFWWFWLLIVYIVIEFVMFKTLTDASIYTIHDSYLVVALRDQLLKTSFPILVFLGVTWLFPRLTGYALSLPLALMQWGLVAIGIFLVMLPQHFVPMNLRYLDYPEAFDKYDNLSLLGGWLFIIGVAAFLPVLLEALVKKRPFEHKRD